MLTVKEVEGYFKQQLGETLDPQKVWSTFKEFGQLPIQDEDDVELLVQCGMENDEFYLDFVRQFTVYEEEEYSHMEQLHCTLFYTSDDTIRNFAMTEWYFETEGEVEDYFNQIEQLEEFKRPMTLKPVRVSVIQEEV